MKITTQQARAHQNTQQQIRRLAKRLSRMNEREVELVLTDILTVAQYTHIAQRHEIAMMLRKGYTQQHIAHTLRAGIATVTKTATQIRQLHIYSEIQ